MPSLIDALFMPSCCSCGQEAPLIVAPYVGVRTCERCALDLSPTNIQVSLRECRRRYAFFEYNGAVAPLLSRAKDEAYGSHYYAVQSLFTDAATQLISHEKAVEIIVTQVPSSLRRSLAGWYLPSAMARHLAKKINAKYAHLLSRKKQVARQSGLGAIERRTNVHGCFTARRFQMRNFTKDSLVVVVDDVSTTGASLGEAVRCLRQTGYTNVMAISLAISPLRSRGC
jgi:predicted amidophosphoribosyltransferase